MEASVVPALLAISVSSFTDLFQRVHEKQKNATESIGRSATITLTSVLMPFQVFFCGLLETGQWKKKQKVPGEGVLLGGLRTRGSQTGVCLWTSSKRFVKDPETAREKATVTENSIMTAFTLALSSSSFMDLSQGARERRPWKSRGKVAMTLSSVTVVYGRACLHNHWVYGNSINSAWKMCPC